MRKIKNTYAHDILGAGGNIYSGWRTVQKGGVIRFDHWDFKSEKLLEHKGERVFVTIAGDGGIWYSSLISVEDSDGSMICFAKNMYGENNAETNQTDNQTNKRVSEKRSVAGNP